MILVIKKEEAYQIYDFVYEKKKKKQIKRQPYVANSSTYKCV